MRHRRPHLLAAVEREEVGEEGARQLQRRRGVGEGNDGRDADAENGAACHMPDLVPPPVKAVAVEVTHAMVPSIGATRGGGGGWGGVPQADLVPPLVKVAVVEAAHGAVPPVGAAQSGGGAAEGLVALEAGGSSGPAPGVVRRTRKRFFYAGKTQEAPRDALHRRGGPHGGQPCFYECGSENTWRQP
jgi:hypothetical protein